MVNQLIWIMFGTLVLVYDMCDLICDKDTDGNVIQKHK